jgi:hypothetical protein
MQRPISSTKRTRALLISLGHRMTVDISEVFSLHSVTQLQDGPKFMSMAVFWNVVP